MHKHHNIIFFVALKPQLHPVLLPGYPKDRTAVIGDTTMLFCADTSDILVDYRWLKWDSSVKSFTQADFYNGTLFTMLHPKDYEQVNAHNKRGVYLKLTNLTKADEGLYTCLAMNMYMRYSYRSAFLTVKQPPQSKAMLQLKIFSCCFPVLKNVGSELVHINTEDQMSFAQGLALLTYCMISCLPEFLLFCCVILMI